MEMQTNIGRDRVYLSASSLAEGIQISESTFARGIRELIDKKFIAPSTHVSWYWLNPDFVWNGDRIAFVKEYRRAGAASVIPGHQQELLPFDDSGETT
jgi:DNA-binding IclR family transcriptional regulator